MSRRPPFRRVAAAGLACALLAGCATTARSNPAIGGTGAPALTALTAVASINAWGSILTQLGGDRVRTISIISNPNTDPHDYEPTPADSRVIAGAKLLVVNGVGYDSWAGKVARANPDPSRQTVDVGRLMSVPDGGNPHRWYSPADVRTVADQITADLSRADPADAGYFEGRRQAFENTGLAEYHRLIAAIKTRYAGTAVGASESIFTPLAQALGLDLITPASFLAAISEGTDPSAADKATIDSQLSRRQLAVYVFNSQNATPDVSAQVQLAKQEGIAVSSVTETLSPAGASFQDWQCAQLRALQAALAQATGR
ncbi:MAG: metal ABC transporter solute-binding protein, Zn/Mn family [Jatrophihabitans sp.]